MSDGRALRAAKRSLERKRELQELAARGDKWARKRLQVNQYQLDYHRNIRDSAASGDNEAKQQLSGMRAKKGLTNATYRQKQRDRKITSHSQSKANQNAAVESSPSLEDDMRLRRSRTSSTRAARHGEGECDNAATPSPAQRNCARSYDGPAFVGAAVGSNDDENRNASEAPSIKAEVDSTNPSYVKEEATSTPGCDTDTTDAPVRGGMEPRMSNLSASDTKDFRRPGSSYVDRAAVDGDESSVTEEELKLKLRRKRLEREEVELELEMLELRKRMKSNA